MKSFFSRVTALFFLFLFLCLQVKVSAESGVGKVVILFDNSVTDSKYNPRIVSKVWFKTFVKSFHKPYDITLAGFDDIITEHLRAVVATDEERESVKAKADKIVNNGFTSDFETPLAYLVDRQENEPLLFAVVITNGKPEIWNEKEKTLSRRIKFDFRYDDLNERYDAMEQKHTSHEDIYNQLNSEYQDRNIELIEKKLVVFTQELAKKTIFVDLFNGTSQLREWADIAGVHYIHIKRSIDKSPLERLSNLIYSIEELAGKELREELPENYKESIDEVIDEEPDLSALSISNHPNPAYVPKAKEKIRIEVSSRAIRSMLVPTIFGLALLPFIVVFFFRRKDGDDNNEPDIPLDDKVTPESLENEVTALELPTLPAEAIKVDEEPEEKLDFKPSDINLSLRVSVPAGLMKAYWFNDDGNIVSGAVLSISLDRVHFKAKGYNGSLQRVKSEKFNAEFRVTDSHLENGSANETVVVIERFDDDTTTRMNWIGLLADIEDINY